MTERDGAAMRVDEVGIVLDAELTQAGDALAGEGFIEFDQIEIADLQPQPRHAACASPAPGPMPMMRGGTDRPKPVPKIRARGVKPCFFTRGFGGENHRRRAVIDAGGVARRHRAGIAHDRL